MTLQEQQQRRFEQAIAFVWQNELEMLARLPRRIRDRAALRRASALAKSRKRIAWSRPK